MPELEIHDYGGWDGMGCSVSSLESLLTGFGLVAFRCFCERGSVCLREREREHVFLLYEC